MTTTFEQDLGALRGFDSCGADVRRAFDESRRQFSGTSQLGAERERQEFELLISLELDIFAQVLALPGADSLWSSWSGSVGAHLRDKPLDNLRAVQDVLAGVRSVDLEERCAQLDGGGLLRPHRALFISYAFAHSPVVQARFAERYQRLRAIKRVIIEANLPLAYRRRMGGLPAAHSLLLGLIGLADAMDRFSLSRGRFATYADHWILARISRASIIGDGGFREPGYFNERRLKIRRAIATARRDGLELSIRELLDLFPEVAPESLPALVLGSGKWARPMPRGASGAPRAAELTSLSIADDPGRLAELLRAWGAFEVAIAEQPQRDQHVLMARLCLETGKRRTLKSVGADLKLSRERVRQIQRDASKSIFERLGADPEIAGDLLGGDDGE